MLLRGRNTVGYTPRPDAVAHAFVREAAATGVDIFRIFDALNDVSQMRPAIDAVLETGSAVAEVAVCYTADLLDPAETLYTLDYYLRLADRIVESGAHILAIKDMAGLLRPAAAAKLVSALRERFDLPVHLHTHDTAGGQLATLLAASAAGVDAVDAAAAPLSGTTSQPSLSALVAAMAHTERDTGIDLAAVSDLEPYWEGVRTLYSPFESGLPGPTGRVYHHEIPGGQLSNLRQQAIALGMADDFELIEDMYAAADRILGRIPKVTPSSKVVGDLALALVAANADPADFAENPQNYDIPDSVVGFMAGELGDLPGGWPEPFRTKVLAGRHISIEVPPLTDAERDGLAGDATARRRTLNRLLFPGPAKEFEARPRGVRRPVGSRHARLPLRAVARRGAHRRDRPGRAAVRRTRGDRRGRREGHADGHDDPQRPAAAGVRPRPQHRCRVAPSREGGHFQAGSGRRAVLGRGHGEGRGRRHGQGRSARRIDRGDEDGSGDHRARRRRRGAARDPGDPAGRSGRPFGRHPPWTVAWRVRHPPAHPFPVFGATAVTPDRNDPTHADDDENEQNGVLSHTGSLESTGIGFLGGQTEQVSVVLPSNSDEDLVDDDVIDDEVAFPPPAYTDGEPGR